MLIMLSLKMKYTKTHLCHNISTQKASMSTYNAPNYWCKKPTTKAAELPSSIRSIRKAKSYFKGT